MYAHFALQELKIRPAVLAGICGDNEPVSYKERVFIYASISLYVEDKKREMAKINK